MILWNYLQEHFGEEDKRDKQDKNYKDEGELRGLFDDTFLLAYLSNVEFVRLFATLVTIELYQISLEEGSRRFCTGLF